MSTPYFTLAIGFLAQGFFSARIFVQWLLSERARKVLSPSVFWVLSLAGAYLLCFYGWLRNDFSIVLGQLLSYYIYLWNLKMKGVMQRIPFVLRIVLLLTPVVVLILVMENADDVAARFLCNADVPLWLLVWGTAGQVLFTMRFVYQWLYSRRAGESRLPAGFWLMSLVGALAIVSYGAMRRDLVLIVGQGVGVAAYIRNLMLIKKKKYKSYESFGYRCRRIYRCRHGEGIAGEGARGGWHGQHKFIL